MAPQSEARRHLAALMDERRLELRLTWQEVADHGGVSLRALSNARTGDVEIRPLTQAGIEAGLQWDQGSIELVLAGGNPVPLGAASEPLPPRTGLPADEDDDDVLAALEIPEEIQDAFRDHRAAIRDRIRRAKRKYPGQRLAGEMIFGPRNRRDAESWDSLAGAGRPEEGIVAGLAIVMAYEDKRASEGKGRRDIRAVLTRR